MKHSAYCKDPDCPLCRRIPESIDPLGYTPKQYAVQYRNKPKPQWPPTGPLRVPPLTSRHYTGIITDDLTDYERGRRSAKEMHTQYQKWLNHNKVTKEDHVNSCRDPDCPICGEGQKPKKEVKKMEEDKSYEYQNLYEVITTYGGDRDSVIVKRIDVVAESESRALMQSKDDIDPEWDMDYVEQDVHSVGQVRVKRKPRETKEVVK